MKIPLRVLGLVTCAILDNSVACGSIADKRELTADAYDRWNSIVAPVLSNDGQWVAYLLESATGSSQLVVRATRDTTEFRVVRGVVPRMRTPRSLDERIARGALLRAPPQITADSRFVVFTLIDRNEQGGNAESARKLSIDTSAALGILRLSDGALTRISRAGQLQTPKEAGRHIAYTLENDSKDGLTESVDGRQKKILVVRDLDSGQEVQISDVREFTFQKGGQYIAYTVESDEPERSGAYVRRLSDGKVVALLSGPGQYRGLTFDATGEQLAFLSSHGSANNSTPGYGLYYTGSPLVPASAVVPASAIEASYQISADAGIEFARLGAAVIFHLTPVSRDTHAPLHTTEASFDLWHWEEPAPLPQGRYDERSVSIPAWKKSLSYPAIYHIRTRHWVRLGSELTPKVLITDDARYAIGLRPDRLSSSWERLTADVFLLDAHSGEHRLVRRKLQPGLQGGRFNCPPRSRLMPECQLLSLSPGGRYALFFDERRWWSVELATGKTVDLTGRLLPDIHFDVVVTTPLPQSQNLQAAMSPVAGWTKDDQRVWLYDEHDIWEIDPAGKIGPRNVTKGFGRQGRIIFRLLEDFSLALNTAIASPEGLPRSDLLVDPSQSFLLFALDPNTMASGIWRLRPSASPEKLLMLDKRVTPIAKAPLAPQYLLTLQTFAEYPDLWVGSRFDQLSRISNANPQQNEYRWGTAELVEFTSDWGVPLKGVLYKPEDFDPSKKYGMIVSVYEISHGRLHVYGNPEPLGHAPVGGRTVWPLAVSRGYLHFVPDIHIASPYPLASALAAVVPAVQSIIDRGFVDAERIALTGHSFAGFEALYLITQTNLFRCAITSAGASNMLSVYGSHHSGPRFLERGQMVLGGSIWDRPFAYITNSSLFYADRVQTPLLMMHNNADTHPPMSQGIEFFNALRRNRKEAYLFNYHGEGHVLLGRANQLDWDKRVQEFLEYYLKDAPKPHWMIRP